jgi:hypothetical protein
MEAVGGGTLVSITSVHRVTSAGGKPIAFLVGMAFSMNSVGHMVRNPGNSLHAKKNVRGDDGPRY